jgi:hypothetical protein
MQYLDWAAAANLSDETLKRISNILWRAGSPTVAKFMTGVRLRIVLIQILDQTGVKASTKKVHASGPAMGIE